MSSERSKGLSAEDLVIPPRASEFVTHDRRPDLAAHPATVRVVPPARPRDGLQPGEIICPDGPGIVRWTFACPFCGALMILPRCEGEVYNLRRAPDGSVPTIHEDLFCDGCRTAFHVHRGRAFRN